MARTCKRIAQILLGIELTVQDFTPQVSPREVNKVQSEIKKIIPDIPKKCRESSSLLKLCIEGCKIVKRKGSRNRCRFIDAIHQAISAVICQLNSPINSYSCESAINKSGYLLWELLGRNMERCPYTFEPSAENNQQQNVSNLTLDDVAALFIQLDPSDMSSIIHIQYILADISKRSISPELVKRNAEKAVNILDGIVLGKSSSSDSAMTEVGTLIEAAQDALISSQSFNEPVCDSYAEEESDEANNSEDIDCVNNRLGVTEEKTETIPEENVQFDMLPADADQALLKDYITENRELIEGAEEALLALEANPDDDEAINTVFRAFHTIKGTSAFLALNSISEFAHRAENLLSRIRDKEITCTGGYADLALKSSDMLKELMQTVDDAMSGDPMTKPAEFDALFQILKNPEAAGVSEDSFVKVQSTNSQNEVASTATSSKEIEVTREGENGTENDDQPDSQKAQNQSTNASKRTLLSKQGAEASTRVRTDRLDRLIDTVGELVIAQTMVAQDNAVLRDGNHDLARKVAHTSKIVRELQDLSMSMRMVPLKATFNKMARLVRDLARNKGKMVNFVGEGEDTEIDRNMVETINDPLVHMVRNAVDHGLESPEEREKSSKPREGTVQLFAYHSGSSVVVEIKDDGRGLNKEKILQKAIAKGLIDSESNLSDNEIYALIFKPGFSTAEKVTDVSGRGVGLDVVKKGVERLRGRIDISSEFGKGSTFTIKMPLTLAITDGMLVQVGNQRFIVPTINIHKTFRPDIDSLSTVVERGEMVMLRDEIMPIFRLHRIFNISGSIEDPLRGLLLIVGDEERRCALLVDKLLGQQQVVAKRLGDGIGKVQGVSGAAILGDGRVGLILDTTEIQELAKHTSVTEHGRELSSVEMYSEEYILAS